MTNIWTFGSASARATVALAAVVAALLLVSGPATAQEGEPRAAAVDPTVPDIAPGYEVRLHAEGDTLQGRWLAPEGSVLRLEADGSLRRVPLSEVERLWVRSTRTRTGAIVGAVTGAAVTGTLLGLLVQALCEAESCRGPDDFAAGFVVGGAIGAAGGGIAGGVIGSWMLRWKPVLP